MTSQANPSRLFEIHSRRIHRLRGFNQLPHPTTEEEFKYQQQVFDAAINLALQEGHAYETTTDADRQTYLTKVNPADTYSTFLQGLIDSDPIFRQFMSLLQKQPRDPSRRSSGFFETQFDRSVIIPPTVPVDPLEITLDDFGFPYAASTPLVTKQPVLRRPTLPPPSVPAEPTPSTSAAAFAAPTVSVSAPADTDSAQASPVVVDPVTVAPATVAVNPVATFPDPLSVPAIKLQRRKSDPSPYAAASKRGLEITSDSATYRRSSSEGEEEDEEEDPDADIADYSHPPPRTAFRPDRQALGGKEAAQEQKRVRFEAAAAVPYSVEWYQQRQQQRAQSHSSATVTTVAATTAFASTSTTAASTGATTTVTATTTAVATHTTTTTASSRTSAPVPPKKPSSTTTMATPTVVAWSPPIPGSIFDGTTNVKEFFDTYEALANTYHWDPAAQLSQLQFYLKGMAKSCYKYLKANATSSTPLTYAAVKKELMDYFSTKISTQEWEKLLRERKYTHGEDIQAYLWDINRYVRKVHKNPDIDIVKNHVVQGLPSGLAQEVWNHPVKTFKELHSKILEIQKFQSLMGKQTFMKNDVANQLVHLLEKLGIQTKPTEEAATAQANFAEKQQKKRGRRKSHVKSTPSPNPGPAPGQSNPPRSGRPNYNRQWNNQPNWKNKPNQQYRNRNFRSRNWNQQRNQNWQPNQRYHGQPHYYNQNNQANYIVPQDAYGYPQPHPPPPGYNGFPLGAPMPIHQPPEMHLINYINTEAPLLI